MNTRTLVEIVRNNIVRIITFSAICTSIGALLVSPINPLSERGKLSAIKQAGELDDYQTLSAFALDSGESEEIRSHAIALLGRVSSLTAADHPAKKDLIVLLDDRSERVRYHAIQSLRRFKTIGLVPVYVETMRKYPSSTGASAAFALGDFGPRAYAATPDLVRALTSERQGMRGHAAISLGKIRDDPGVVVPALIRSLNDEHFMVRRWAAEALAEYGPVARSALPHLRRTLDDPDPHVQLAAIWAIVKIEPIGNADLVPKLIDMIESSDEPVSTTAMIQLIHMKTDAELAVPVLIESIRSDDRSRRNVASFVLTEIGGSVPDFIPLLIHALETEDAAVFYAVARCLQRLGPTAYTAVPALEARLSDPDPRVRRAAEQALGEIR